MTRTEAERRLIRADRALTGLACLLNAGELADRLRRQGADIGALLEVDYLRYKPGENCIARFRYEANGATHWGYAKAHGANASVKLAKSSERPDLGSAAGPGRLQIEELGTEVVFLPNDNRLPSIGRFGQPGPGGLLSRVFKNDPDLAQGELSVLNYKPERRLTARLERGDGPASVLKFFAPGQFRATRRFHKRLRPVPGVRLPLLAGGSKAHRVMAFDWISGQSLDEALGAGELHAVTEAAGALARFHATPQPKFPDPNDGALGRQLDALANDLAAFEPELGEKAAPLAAELAARIGRLPANAGPIHGDFNPAQVIVGSAGVGLIDCDRTGPGDPAEDLGSFIARLHHQGLQGRIDAATAEAAERLLLDAYRAAAPAADLSQLGVHVAVGLFRLLHHPFRERAEDWPSHTQALLRACSQRLREQPEGE